MGKLLVEKPFIILFAIFIVAITLRPSITSVGPLVDVILEDLALSNAQVSLLTAVPILCMGIFASLAPLFNRKFGIHKTMYMMLVIIGVATSIRVVASSYIQLLITALFIGLAVAVMGPLLSAMIKQYFPQHIAFVIGVYSFGIGVGAMLSSGLAGVIYEKTASYPIALSIWGWLALLAIVIWRVAMRRVPIVQEQLQKEQSLSPWKVGKAWLLLLFFGLQTSLFFSIMTWLVPILTSKGMSIVEAGAVLSIMTAAQIVTNLLIPFALKKVPSKTFWVSLLCIASMSALFLLWGIGGFTVWISAIFLGAMLGATFPIALQFPLDLTTTPTATNDWTAMMQTGGFIFSGLTPIYIGLLYDRTANHLYSIIFLSVLLLVMIVITIIIERDHTTSTSVNE